MSRLSRQFYARFTPDVAKDLLGCILVRVQDGVQLVSRIVEVEAYRGSDDPASHAYRGLTKRTAVMFGEAGHAYVYFTMGVHYCLNITTETVGKAGAVLLRAAEPVEGVDEMLRRRRVDEIVRLTNGPGNLTKALGIDLSMNGEDVVQSNVLFLLPPESAEPTFECVTTTRIGISSGRDKPWRFYIKGNPFVSGYRGRALHSCVRKLRRENA